MIDSIIALVVLAATFLFFAFCLAWVTIFPTIGLLYWFGYLS